jgi:hypothetical protein
MTTGRLKSNVAGGTNPIKIRTKPSLSADFVSKAIGTEVRLLGETSIDSDGYTWHHVQFDSTKTGWVREDVIEILPDVPTPPPDTSRLFFETDQRKVRVFEDGSAVLMNVYNKLADKTEVNRGAAAKLPPDAFSETYVSTQGGRSYHASFVRRGETQLRIVDSATGTDVAAIEKGFGARGTEYQNT